MKSETIALFGLPISNVSMAQAISQIEALILSGKTHQIATANLDFARNSLRDPYLQKIICDCSMVLPDGAPMLWASAMFRTRIRQRVTGCDLIPELARLSQDKGYGIYLLGSTDASSMAAAAALQDRFPGVRIVGRHSPQHLPLDKMDHEEMIVRINAARPAIILVSFGNPKQEIWIHSHKSRLVPAVLIGVGGALDLIGGKLRRAPKWMQKLHCEWVYRMVQEPTRLVPRYVGDIRALVGHLPLGVAANRLQPFERRERGSSTNLTPGVRVFAAPGKLGNRAAVLVRDEARQAASAGESLVIDMSATLRVEAEGLGGLLEARRLMLERGLWIWLAAMSNPVRRVLQFSSVTDLFRIAQAPEDAIRCSRAAFAGVRADNKNNVEGLDRSRVARPEGKSVVVATSR